MREMSHAEAIKHNNEVMANDSMSISHQDYTFARRNLMGGTVVYTALTTNGLFWQRIIQLRTKNGEYQGKLLNSGKWVEITELREG